MLADRLRSFAAFAATFATIACATGCVGARTNVVAADAAYPISLSRAVRDAEGAIIPQERAVKVGTFHDETKAWGLFYSAIRLNPQTDISRSLNEQIKTVAGDAVVNLRVMSSVCAMDYVGVFVFAPLWPGCANIVVEGDIIKVKR
jgi:hypothetical protein